jgi:hypothetical protein
MQAIVTKYLNPTDTKGSRIKATCDAGSVTIPYPHELSGIAVHEAAVAALLAKLEWETGEWVGGSLPNQAGYVFVYRA